MFGFCGRLLCTTLILGANVQAIPTLTVVQDTLFTADGRRFNGVVTISWQGFEASDTSTVAAETRRLRITNGALYVQLVPTTNANTPAIYNVQYTSQDGLQYSEAWAVPPGILPVRVRDVKVTPGTVTGSAPGLATTVQISDVTGLQNALNIRLTSGPAFSFSRVAIINPTGSIDGATGNLSDCLHVDGSSGACGSGGSGMSGTFVDGEIPSGTLDGVNTTFTLANAPIPISSLALFRNGLLLRQSIDYTVSARSVAFLTGAVPQPGDVLLASYRISVNLTSIGFVDSEVPSGSVNGTNTVFTLSQTPLPASGVSVYRNGLRLAGAVDYTISGNMITFASSVVPQAGDLLLCSYRIAQ